MESIRPVCRSLFQTATHRPRTCHASHRHFRTSAARFATLLPITQPGPPPPAPEPPSNPDDSVARKRKQVRLLRQGQSTNADPSKPGQQTFKQRFWKNASVVDTENGLRIMLDSRPVRTASKEMVTLPHSKPHLATAIAHEWDHLVSVHQALKQDYIPLTSIVSHVIDIQNADRRNDRNKRRDIVEMIMKFLETDTLLCWAPERPSSDATTRESLRSRQERVAREIIGYLTTRVWPGVEIRPQDDETSILPATQPEMTKQVIRGWIHGLPAFELAALERAALGSKSLLVAARLLVEWSQHFGPIRGERTPGKAFGIKAAAEACSLEVSYQTEVWGEVEDTHDVNKEDLRRQLGSAIFLVIG